MKPKVLGTVPRGSRCPPSAFFLVLFFLGAVPSGWAVTSIREANQLLETRSGAWIAFKARVTLTAAASEGRGASCQGQIAYERLNERFLLICLNARKELLFAFKAEDRNFEFYQPSARTLFTGTIFDLEDAPDLHSHIHPLALYRALKTGAIPEKDGRIEFQNAEGFRISVKGRRAGKVFIKRRLTATTEGDVTREVFLNKDGGEKLLISRSDFTAHKKQGLSRKEKYVFPEKVTLEETSEGGRKVTQLFFDRFDFTPTLASDSWNLPVPPGTRRVNVSEGFEKLQNRAGDF